MDAADDYDKTLKPDDAAQILREILPVQTKTVTFALELKLPCHTIEAIHKDYAKSDDRLFPIITAFLRQVEPRPTWRVIAEALSSPTVGLPHLAQEIMMKHGHLKLVDVQLTAQDQKKSLLKSAVCLVHWMLRKVRFIRNVQQRPADSSSRSVPRQQQSSIQHQRQQSYSGCHHLTSREVTSVLPEELVAYNFEGRQDWDGWDAQCNESIAHTATGTSDDVAMPSQPPSYLSPIIVVKAEIKDFRRRFKSIKASTIQCLERCHITVMKVVCTLTEIKAVDPHKVFLEKKRKALSSSETHSQLFYLLNLYWNYLSYDLLDQLIEELALEMSPFQSIGEEMAKYKADLQVFKQCTRLRLFCQAHDGCAEINPPPHFRRMVISHKWPNNVTLEDVERFRRSYADEYNLQNCAMMLGGIIEGSFTVTWFVPVTVVDVLRKGRPLLVYKEFDVSRVEIAGVCVYQCKEEMSHLRHSEVPPRPPARAIASMSLANVPVADTVTILEEKFKYLRELTKQSMETHQISLKRVAGYVTSLPADTENEHPEILKSLGTVLYKVVDHFELLGAVIYYWHYLCYDLLDHMTHTFDLNDVQSELQLYKRDVQHFLRQTKLVEFCRTEKMKRVCPPEFSELVTEILWPDTVKLERVEEFRKEYLQNYHLHNYAMILAFAQLTEPFNAFRIHWFVPAPVTGILKASIPKELIEIHNICRLEIAGECVYPHKEMDGDKIFMRLDDGTLLSEDDIALLLQSSYRSKVQESAYERLLSQLVRYYDSFSESIEGKSTKQAALDILPVATSSAVAKKVMVLLKTVTEDLPTAEAIMLGSSLAKEEDMNVLMATLPKIQYNIITDDRNPDSIIPGDVCTNVLEDKPEDEQPEDEATSTSGTASTDSGEHTSEVLLNELRIAEKNHNEFEEFPGADAASLLAEAILTDIPDEAGSLLEATNQPEQQTSELLPDEQLVADDEDEEATLNEQLVLDELMVAENNKDKDEEFPGADIPEDVSSLAEAIAQPATDIPDESSLLTGATALPEAEFPAEAHSHAEAIPQPETDIPAEASSLAGATVQPGASHQSVMQAQAVGKIKAEETYDFVKNPPNHFFCPILVTTLVEPHLTECCGNHLSKEAAARIKGEKKPCPLCNKRKLKTMLDRNFQRQVLELPVFCHNRKRGCGWVGELSTFERHIIDRCQKQDNPLAEQKVLGHEVLTKDNEGIIVNELIKMRQAAYELGLALKVPREILDTIKAEEKKPLNQLIRVIGEFLSQENPKPTWTTIVEALQSPQIRRPKLAKKIEKMYCTVVEAVGEECDFSIPDKSVVRFTDTRFGHGFFGEVLEVAYEGKRYAAKQYREAADDVVLRTFGEKEALCKIRHPNLMPYYGVCKLAASDVTVVAMEKMDQNLCTFLERDISQVQKFQILYDVVKGLNHLHTQRPAIIHGHLNERNVLLNSRGVAKIGDFGNFHMVQSALTSTANASLEYMSPEALEGSVPNDKFDVFSLGHLSIYVINQMRPHPLKRPTYRDQGKFVPRTEVDRREEYLDQMKLQLDEMHPLYSIIINCLKDEASERPSCEDILQRRVFPALIPDPLEKDPLDPDTVVRATGVILGHGAYGDVEEAEYKGKMYAAKQHRSKGIEEQSQEHEILTQIRHRNIVPYYGLCKLAPNNLTVMLMQRMEENLAVFLEHERNTRLNLERKYRILQDVVCGLHHLHTDMPAIIHRDLTATNVLLDAVGTAKIGDFGNALVVDRHSKPACLTAIPGTIDYMPPEAQDCGEYDNKLDIFSLGHLLVYIMIQHRPQPLLGHTCREHGNLRARTEVERRSEYLDEVKSRLDGGDQHPIYSLTIHCLQDEARDRPSCGDILGSGVLKHK